GRGSLPPGSVRGRVVGRGAVPPPRDRRRRLPLGHRLERRGVRGVDRDAARPHAGGDRGAPPGPARGPLPGGSDPPPPARGGGGEARPQSIRGVARTARAQEQRSISEVVGESSAPPPVAAQGGPPGRVCPPPRGGGGGPPGGGDAAG